MAKHRQRPPLLQLIALSGMLLLSACSFSTRDSGPSQAMDFSHLPDAIPTHEKRTRAGNPSTYEVLGKRYQVMASSQGYIERGIASWYGKKFHGRKTSNGEVYNMYAMTAAHKTLPIPSYLQVTNLKNGKQVIVRVNDRGPFHDNRIVDLSYAAASKLGIIATGTGMVELRALEPDQPTSRVADSKPAAAPASPPYQGGTQLNNKLYLQLGSFISRDNAESLRARLVINNVSNANVLTSTVDRKNIYRVRIGPLPSVEEADRLAVELDRLGIGVPSIVID
jgi:rare lipoprotein A